MEISETGIERCIREHLINLQSSFSKYFPEKMNDKYSWIRDPFHEVSPPNNDFSLKEEEKYIDLTSDTSLKLRFRRESLTEFLVGVREEYPHLSKKAINNLLRFATSYLCETRFSGVAALKTKYRSMMNIESDLRVAISRLQSSMKSYVARNSHIFLTETGTKLFYSLKINKNTSTIRII
jgi:hypothetical protein